MTIDLHLHTTASDGRCSPQELVDRAAAAGVTVMAVTDHDTTAAIDDVRSAASVRGIETVGGIEITAVEAGRDVHILGYFIDPADIQLSAFLMRQRTHRIARVVAVGDRLAQLGMPIDTGPLIAKARQESGRSVGRPQIARAMVTAGYVVDTREAFDRWLATGRPAFVPRAGPSPEEVIAIAARRPWRRVARPPWTDRRGRKDFGVCQRWSRCARGLPSGSRQGLDRALPRCSRTI